MPEQTIILIRHAEKVHWTQGLEPSDADHESYVDNHLLSPRGCERAFALVGYFKHRQEMRSLFSQHPLALVMAQDVDTGPDPFGESQRPKQTLEPLVQALNARMDLEDGFHSGTQGMVAHTGAKMEYRLFVKNQILDVVQQATSREFHGKSILIAWSHKLLPQLAKAFGVPADEVPKKWPKKRFDLTWVIHRSSEDKVTLEQLPQRLLFGDKENV